MTDVHVHSLEQSVQKHIVSCLSRYVTVIRNLFITLLIAHALLLLLTIIFT